LAGAINTPQIKEQSLEREVKRKRRPNGKESSGRAVLLKGRVLRVGGKKCIPTRDDEKLKGGK